jgi:hypothetical protein
MASSFQRYSGQGIQPVTGMAEAGANIGRMYQQGLGQLGEAIGQGIKVYGENQQKSQMADAKLASGIERFKQISSIYAQDPEFAPVVASFADRMAAYQDAPNQSLSKKLVMANDIDSMVGELASTIQAQQVVRGRQIERVGGELLNQFKGVEKVTDPAVIREGTSKFNTGKDYGSNEGEFLTGLNRFREAAKSAGREIKGTDAEALDAYRRDVVETTNQAMSAGTLDKGIGSKILEQVEAQRRLSSVKAGVVGGGATMGDLETLSGTAYKPETDTTNAAKNFAPDWLINQAKEEKKKPIELESKIQVAGVKVANEVLNNVLNRVKSGEKVTPADIKTLLVDSEIKNNPTVIPSRDVSPTAWMLASSKGETEFNRATMDVKKYSPAAKEIIEVLKGTGLGENQPLTANDVLKLSSTLSPKINEFQKASEKLVEQAKKITSESQDIQQAQAPVLPLGKMNVGQIEYERKVNQAEKKAKIADLMTQRIGTIDPVTGKKTLPVGFDAYYKKMVPESDARVIDVDGVKLFWDGSKLEQVKGGDKGPTPKDIGEAKAYVFGNQTENGIEPVELVPDSGVYISGVVSAASTSTADKVRENLTDMIDLRGTVSRLTTINDKFGESVSLRDQGVSQYDLMKLRSVLTKQINVSGSISDQERKAIKDMTPDPTAFLDFEPKTRAALLGIAQGIDRDIKTLATSRGLSVTIKENGGMTQNQSLRQKFLSSR